MRSVAPELTKPNSSRGPPNTPAIKRSIFTFPLVFFSTKSRVWFAYLAGNSGGKKLVLYLSLITFCSAADAVVVKAMAPIKRIAIKTVPTLFPFVLFSFSHDFSNISPPLVLS